ncbi:MAG: HAD family hydrolase [Bacteroidota bacterium]
MKLNQLHRILERKNIEVIFSDYFDTIAHRKVHPNQVQRIWAKIMIRELGLDVSIDHLYYVRKEATQYLKKKPERDDVEIPYKELQLEICKRCINDDTISIDQKDIFLSCFEDADLKSELSVQYLNDTVVNTLRAFKEQGGKVYLISDFYGSVELFNRLLKHHGIFDLFDAVFSSSSLEKSKFEGTIFDDVIAITNATPETSIMIGDNKTSDGKNAAKSGLNTFILPHKKYHREHKRNNFGNDYKQVKRALFKVYKDCRKGKPLPYTEYILHYHLFIEQLYYKCRKDHIKDLFFLAREGLFLKKLFDSYQDYHLINGEAKVHTHYLRMSRQSSLQIALNPIDEESFDYLKKNFDALSVMDFFKTFTFSDSEINQITTTLTHDSDQRHEFLFTSEVFQELKQNTLFRDYYEQHRKSHSDAFRAYIKSFGVDIKTKGIHLVDIGWGGTMQESLYKFFDEEIPVTGYYLGLKEIYNITEHTKRYGLNFSVLPYINYSDYILMANTQLYEQFLSANHGSALGYDTNADNFTLEYHQPKEKWLYDNYIKDHQTATFKIHETLLENLEALCYNQEDTKNALTKIALKVGLFQNSKKLKFLETLSNGFYQNIGDNQVGVVYEPPKIDHIRKRTLRFIMRPEYYFRYLVKIKPALFRRNTVIAFFTPSYIFYLYYKFNYFIRFRVLRALFLLRYNFFK